MNGATEATLADLLATAQAMNVNLIKLQQLAKSSGSAGGSIPASVTGGASASITATGAAAKVASVALTAVQVAASAVGTVLGVMGGILGKVVGVTTGLVKSLYSLGVATAISGTKLSEFYEAFASVPLIGKAFSILADVIRYQEQLLEFFQQITMNGASFSGSLMQMKSAATRSYMSMQDFASVVRENSEVFATMGATVTGGVNRFVDIQNKMLGPRSEYGNMMYGLGYTAKTSADMLAHYIKIQGTMNKEGLESNDAIIKGTLSAARELDILSQLTGKNNQDLKKKAEQLQADEAFEAFKFGKSAKEVEAMDASIKAMLAFGNEAGATQLKLGFMGLNVARTAEQQALFVQSGGKSTQLIDKIVSDFNNKQPVQALVRSIAMGSWQIGEATTKYNRTLGPVSALLTDSMLKASVGFSKTYRDNASSSDIIIKETLARKNQTEAAKGSAAALERAQQGIRNFGEQMLMLASQIIGPLIPFLQFFANGVVRLTNELGGLAKQITQSGGFKDAINGIITWFQTTFKSLGSSTSASDFFNRLGTQMGVAFDAIKPALTSIFNKFVDFMKPYMIEMLTTVEDYVNATMFQKTGTLFGAEDPEIRKKQRAYERLELAAQTLYERAGIIAATGNNSAAMRQTEEAAAKMAEAMEAKKIWERASGKGKGTARAVADNPLRYHSGTIGVTGDWWLKSDQTAELQKGEAVVTQSQMAQIVDTASQKGYAEAMQQVNSTQMAMLATLKQIAIATERNVTATKNLDGNLFARA